MFYKINKWKLVGKCDLNNKILHKNINDGDECACNKCLPSSVFFSDRTRIQRPQDMT